MRGVGLRGAQAPFATAGQVRPDPLPLGSSILCTELNGSARFLGVRQLFNTFQREGSLPEYGVTIGVTEQLGSVGAHWAIDRGLFG